MLKWFSSALLTLVLLFVLVAGMAEGTEEATGPVVSEYDAFEPEGEDTVEDLNMLEFGPDAVVERDAQRRAISVNGYPTRVVNAALNIRSTTEPFQYEIDFADYPFWRPATIYDGNLAMMSLTMAMCANRALNLRQEPEKDFNPSLNVERFFADAGFTDIRKDDYSKETSMYTVSTAIGSRRMEHEGEEPFTLIAVGVCGAFYKNEWQSNMTPGDGDVHEGFASAAGLVIDRVSGYILSRGIKGRIKLWISGFSRAAAISNLVAGTLVKDGVLAKEDVYAYTFATPAAVFHPAESGFENIFNIISPMDLVPQVMPSEWGFGRYGRDLFLPLTEFSSLGTIVMHARREVALEYFGIDTTYSPALNLRMRLLFSLLMEILESRDHYNAIFQPAVVGIMQRKNASNTLATLRALLLQSGRNKDYDRTAVDRFLNFAFRVFDNVLTRRELAATNTNSGGAAIRLLNEHREDTYLACINIIHQNFFETDLSFTYVLIRGPVQVRVFSPEDAEFEAVLPEKETPMVDDAYENGQLIYMERLKNVSILAIPRDLDYRVEWEAMGDGTVEVRQAVCSAFASVRYPGAASPAMRVKAGDTGVAYEQENGETKLPDGFVEASFTAPDLASFLGIDSLGVNWRIALMGVHGLLGVLAGMVLTLAARLSRKQEKADGVALLCLIAFSVSTLETETAYWFFADQTAVWALWKAAAGTALIALFFRQRNAEASLAQTVFPGLLALVLSNVLVSYSLMVGVAANLAGHVLLVISFLRHAPIRRGKWVQWATVSLAVSGLIIWRFVPVLGMRAWIVAVYAPVLLLLSWCAGRQPVRLRYAIRLLLTSDLLLGFFFMTQGDTVFHIVYALLYSLSLLLMAIEDKAKNSSTGAVPERREGIASVTG